MDRDATTLLRAAIKHVIAAWLLGSAASISLAAEAPVFMLPDFSTPDYACDNLRAVILQRQQSPGKDAYDVVLQDQGGAEYMGDPAGMVGWRAESTITFVGAMTIKPCKAENGPTPIVIAGDWLKFSVNAAGRLVYMSGTGSVLQGAVTAKLPLKAVAPKPAKTTTPVHKTNTKSSR